MPADVDVNVAEPRHGSASAAAEPSRESEEVVHATEGGGGKGEFVDATSILESLSPAALRKWKLTGNLPADVEIEKKSKPAVGENEATLAALTSEERRHWRETGNLPSKKAADPSEKSSESKNAESNESSHPLAKIEDLRVKGGADAEVNALHSQREASHKDRYVKDQGKFSGEDQQETMRMAGPLTAQLPRGLLNYFTTLQVHLDHPYQFFREFVRNAEFRGEVLQAAKSGDAGNIAKAAVKFDGALIAEAQKERRRVTNAPAPASSVGGRATAPVDESEAAVRAGDFKRYRAAENEREWRKTHGRRG